MTREFLAALAIFVAVVGVSAVPTLALGEETEPLRGAVPFTEPAAPARSVAAATYQGKSARWWARRAVQNRKNSNARGHTIKRLQRLVRRRIEPGYLHMIAVGATAYAVDRATLERKARCESVNFTDFYNESSRASGVMQFLPSTWATTPFAGYSIFDPLANVMAGAWMHDVGRGGEWACR